MCAGVYVHVLYMFLLIQSVGLNEAHQSRRWFLDTAHFLLVVRRLNGAIAHPFAFNKRCVSLIYSIALSLSHTHKYSLARLLTLFFFLVSNVFIEGHIPANHNSRILVHNMNIAKET